MKDSLVGKEANEWPKEPVIVLESPSVDARGSIQCLVETPMKSALIISSKKGSVRANHYHKSDWHYCYVMSGSIDYYYRSVGSAEKPKHVLIKQGQLFFTPPLLEHAMKFPEDTVFLTLSRNPRNPKAYEDDVVRVNLV